MSLRNTVSLIAAAETRYFFNYRTSIYYEELDTVFASTTKAKNDTEAERVFLPVNDIKKEKKEVIDHKHAAMPP